MHRFTNRRMLCAQTTLTLAFAAIVSYPLRLSVARAQPKAGSLDSLCGRVRAQSTVVDKPRIGRRALLDGEALIGVSGVVRHTIAYDGKPLANIQVHEENAVHSTLNGQTGHEPLLENDAPTDGNGQIADLIGQLMPLGTDQENNEAVQFYKTNAFTLTSVNTLTFATPDGATCTSTTTRTLTNGSGGPNYRLTVSPPVVAPAAH